MNMGQVLLHPVAGQDGGSGLAELGDFEVHDASFLPLNHPGSYFKNQSD
jgi:hypothetical protein